jgi:hypothetical protein
MRRVRWVLVGAAALLALLFGGWVAWVMFEAFYYQGAVGVSLNRELGFTHGSPYVRCGGEVREVFTIESVTPGGVFDRAGFRKGDIVRGLSFTEFYKLLHRNRGRDVTIEVVDGGDGPPLDQRTSQAITFTVPANE